METLGQIKLPTKWKYFRPRPWPWLRDGINPVFKICKAIFKLNTVLADKKLEHTSL